MATEHIINDLWRLAGGRGGEGFSFLIFAHTVVAELKKNDEKNNNNIATFITRTSRVRKRRRPKEPSAINLNFNYRRRRRSFLSVRGDDGREWRREGGREEEERGTVSNVVDTIGSKWFFLSAAK